MRENICLKQKGCLPRSRGSTKRPYEQSWQYAFENFDLTKQILSEVPLEIRTEPMESEGFSQWIRDQNNLWIYASNITQFHYFDLEFANPTNVVLLQIIHPEQPQLLDLAPLSGGPVRVKFEIPLKAERIRSEVRILPFSEGARRMVNKIRIATNAPPPPPALTRKLFAQVIWYS